MNKKTIYWIVGIILLLWIAIDLSEIGFNESGIKSLFSKFSGTDKPKEW